MSTDTTLKGRPAGAGAPLKPSHAKLDMGGGELELPDGRKVKDVIPSVLRSLMDHLGVHIEPGSGHQEVVLSYQRHLSRLGEQAAEAAVRQWLAMHR